jgi:hypothetical protein
MGALTTTGEGGAMVMGCGGAITVDAELLATDPVLL